MFIGFCFYLITVASHYSGLLPPPGTCPQVIPLGPVEFAAEMCPDRPDCLVFIFAGYNPEKKWVVIQKALEETYPEPVYHSYLLHEMVHYLQDYHGQITSRGCSVQNRLERQAYDVQVSYLQQYGYDLVIPEELSPSCIPDEVPLTNEVLVL